MTFESNARPPLIPSQLSAKLRVEQWNSGHKTEIHDADGLAWNLHLYKKQKPDLTSVKQLIWEITLQLKTHAHVDALLATHTLDPKADARLITMIGERSIPFVLKPFSVSALQEEEAYKLANQVLTDYLQKFQKESLKPIKRKLIGRFIDDNLQFKEQM